MIPYGRQTIDEDDIKAVVDVLRSDWLTTGPKVSEFEKTFANYVGAKYAVAVSSGTAALHSAMYAIDIRPGNEVIVPPMTFAATANCVVYQGGTPVFADVDPGTLLLNPAKVEGKINSKTKAVIAVDYAGQPCDYDTLRNIAKKHGLFFVVDACHSLGAIYRNFIIGGLADLSVFSFHPVKHITTGEGGMITTDNESFAERMRIFRNHGITTDHLQRDAQGSWFYEMVNLGYNYRMTDFQCALGISQLRKLPNWLARRRDIAQIYDEAFAEIKGIEPLALKANVRHAYHLYVVRVNKDEAGIHRDIFFRELRSRGIGVNVHYVPVHMHPFYRNRYRTGAGMCPIAEEAYDQIISLPIFPSLPKKQLVYIFEEIKRIRLKG